MAKKKKGNSNSSKKSAKKTAVGQRRKPEQQELPNMPNQPLANLAKEMSDRISDGATVGAVTIEFGADGQMRFGWSGATPRASVVESVEIVKQFFLLDEVVQMRQNLINQRKQARESAEEAPRAAT